MPKNPFKFENLIKKIQFSIIALPFLLLSFLTKLYIWMWHFSPTPNYGILKVFDRFLLRVTRKEQRDRIPLTFVVALKDHTSFGHLHSLTIDFDLTKNKLYYCHFSPGTQFQSKPLRNLPPFHGNSKFFRPFTEHEYKNRNH